jgi:MICOS complex subunit MIC26
LPDREKVELSATVRAFSNLLVVSGSQPPIYDIPAPPVVLLETPSQLELQIGVARRAATGVVNNAHAKVQNVVDRWIGVEHAVESALVVFTFNCTIFIYPPSDRVKSIISPSEPLTPGILYVGISTLTGSILSRSRGLPLRLLLPPTFLFVSLQHFLPQTSTNLGAYISSLERTYFPTLAARHAEIDARLLSGWEGIREGSRKGRLRVREAVETLVERAQGVTGLKLQEALGLGQSVARDVQEKDTDIDKSYRGNQTG